MRLLWLALSILATISAQPVSNSTRVYARSTFAALGTPPVGNVRYCTNCNSSSPCASGGSGAFAYREATGWRCSGLPGGSGALSALVAGSGLLLIDDGLTVTVEIDDTYIPTLDDPNVFSAKQTFSAGMNLGTLAADPVSPSDGDYWYNTTLGKARMREGGVSKDAVGVAAYYQTVRDESTALTQRAELAFEGAGVTCADGTTKTVCTIPGSSSSGIGAEVKFTVRDPAAHFAPNVQTDMSQSGTAGSCQACTVSLVAPDDADKFLRWEISLPATVPASASLALKWSRADSGSGNVRWRWEFYCYGAGDALTPTFGGTQTVTTTLPAIGFLAVSTVTLDLSSCAGKTDLVMKLDRMRSDGADTATIAAHAIGARLD